MDREIIIAEGSKTSGQTINRYQYIKVFIVRAFEFSTLLGSLLLKEQQVAVQCGNSTMNSNLSCFSDSICQ
jgi:hypothetical protein